jgi:hypothetical protein
VEERGPEAIRRPGPDGSRGRCRAARRGVQPHQPISTASNGSHRGQRRDGGGAVSRWRSATATFGYGVGALDAWPAMLESMLAPVTVANGGLCGSGIAASQSWLPEALAAARPHVIVLAVTPWSLREDPEAPEQHELDARWPRVETYLRRVTRYSAVADRLSRAVLQRSASWIGWPPPAPVLWELTPLVEPRAALPRALAHGARAARADGPARTPTRRDADRHVHPLDVQVSAVRNVLYRTGRLRTDARLRRPRLHPRRSLRRGARRTAARLRVGFVDTTPMLRALGPAAFPSDSYHLSAEGHAHLAALMTAPSSRRARRCHRWSRPRCRRCPRRAGLRHVVGPRSSREAPPGTPPARPSHGATRRVRRASRW